VPSEPSNGAAAPVPTIPELIGATPPNTRDPAWQPPTQPTVAQTQANARVIHREVPLNVLIGPWDVPAARAAKQQLVVGLFDSPAQMTDAIILSDSRVQAGLSSRLSILGRPCSFRVPRKFRDSAAARECRDAFAEAWPTMATEPAMSELQRWAIMLGFGIAQNIWDFSGEYAIPHPLPWHPRYTYYHWLYRVYVAITMDGQEAIDPGNGSWILHAPHGAYRGWMRGALGAITPWWIGRAYALRDWMRHSEVFGMPMLKAITPAVGDPIQQNIFAAQLRTLGQSAVFHLPQNPPPALSYDVELLEAAHPGENIFRMLIAQCNEEITLAINGQTLTTSMPAEGGSSYAAARVHAGVLQGILEADARALALTVYQQLARPFAALNFGNPDLAPWVVWDVTPFEDAATKAQAFAQIAQALNLFKMSGYELDADAVRRMIRKTIPGFDIGPISKAVKNAEVFAYDLDRAVVSINEARERKGLEPRDDGDLTWPELQQKMGLGPGGSGAEGASAKARIQRLMARIDPRTLLRARIANEDESVREAAAEIEAAHADAARRENARRAVAGMHEEIGDLFGRWG
jgi:hypothetical protein